jgi:hypothetical protein
MPRISVAQSTLHKHAKDIVRSLYAALDTLAKVKGFKDTEDYVRYAFAVYTNAVQNSMCSGGRLETCTRTVASKLSKLAVAVMLRSAALFNVYVVKLLLAKIGFDKYVRAEEAVQWLGPTASVLQDILLGKRTKTKLVDVLVLFVDMLRPEQLEQWINEEADKLPWLLTGSARNRKKARNAVASVRAGPQLNRAASLQRPPSRTPLRRTTSYGPRTTAPARQISRGRLTFFDEPSVQQHMIQNWLDANSHFAAPRPRRR